MVRRWGRSHPGGDHTHQVCNVGLKDTGAQSGELRVVIEPWLSLDIRNFLLAYIAQIDHPVGSRLIAKSCPWCF